MRRGEAYQERGRADRFPLPFRGGALSGNTARTRWQPDSNRSTAAVGVGKRQIGGTNVVNSAAQSQPVLAAAGLLAHMSPARLLIGVSIAAAFTTQGVLAAGEFAAAPAAGIPRPLVAAAPSRGLEDAELMAVREGFAARRDAMIKLQAGQPFKPAKKNPPLAAGRPEYVRAYAWSVTDFAMKTFLLQEPPDAASAALQELCRYFAARRDVRNDYDNFYWSMDTLCRIVEFYGREGSRRAGQLSPEAEDAALEMMWLWAKENSALAEAEWRESKTWRVLRSENHHLQGFTTAWHFSKLLMREARYRDRKCDDGATAAEHYAAWTEYAREYLRERAGKSLFVEIANDGYNAESLKGIYNLYDFATDAELKRRAGLFLDLYWGTWAEEQLGGVRGGGKTRIYPTILSTMGLSGSIARLAWFYFGLGRPTPPHGSDYTMLTSDWRPPLVVVDLALDPAGRGEYEIRQWPLGLAVPGYSHPPEYRLRTDFGGIFRYSWCTPEFILGTLMFESQPLDAWTDISSQNRWQGVIFAAHPDARIVPQVRALSRNRAYNTFWSVQRRGTLITQKLKGSKGAGEMRVWIASAGLRDRTESGGWLFVRAPGAFAAVRPAAGSYRWQDEGAGNRGQWLVPDDPWAPVIIEVARARDAAGYETFRQHVLAAPLRFQNGVLQYQGLGGDTFTFFADYSAPPKINGQTVDYQAPKSFDSPFIQSERDSGLVTIRKGGRRLVLDFNRP